MVASALTISPCWRYATARSVPFYPKLYRSVSVPVYHKPVPCRDLKNKQKKQPSYTASYCTQHLQPLYHHLLTCTSPNRFVRHTPLPAGSRSPYIVANASFCRLSLMYVTLEHRTHTVELFVNIFAPSNNLRDSGSLFCNLGKKFEGVIVDSAS